MQNKEFLSHKVPSSQFASMQIERARKNDDNYLKGLRIDFIAGVVAAAAVIPLSLLYHYKYLFLSFELQFETYEQFNNILQEVKTLDVIVLDFISSM